MTRSTLATDRAFLRANPGLGVVLFDAINERPPAPQPPPPQAPTYHQVWDRTRLGWRLIVTDPTVPSSARCGGVGHTPSVETPGGPLSPSAPPGVSR